MLGVFIIMLVRGDRRYVAFHADAGSERDDIDARWSLWVIVQSHQFADGALAAASFAAFCFFDAS
jgi:hypothetical protein